MFNAKFTVELGKWVGYLALGAIKEDKESSQEQPPEDKIAYSHIEHADPDNVQWNAGLNSRSPVREAGFYYEGKK